MMKHRQTGILAGVSGTAGAVACLAFTGMDPGELWIVALGCVAGAIGGTALGLLLRRLVPARWKSATGLGAGAVAGAVCGVAVIVALLVHAFVVLDWQPGK